MCDSGDGSELKENISKFINIYNNSSDWYWAQILALYNINDDVYAVASFYAAINDSFGHLKKIDADEEVDEIFNKVVDCFQKIKSFLAALRLAYMQIRCSAAQILIYKRYKFSSAVWKVDEGPFKRALVEELRIQRDHDIACSRRYLRKNAPKTIDFQYQADSTLLSKMKHPIDRFKDTHASVREAADQHDAYLKKYFESMLKVI